MIEIRKTERFARWIDTLRDLRGRARVLARIERLAGGNPGEVKRIGEGVSEMRIDYGPGYRVYFKRREQKLIIFGWRGQEYAGQGYRGCASSRSKPHGVRSWAKQSRHATT
jgi:putative addiction module killer protein